jgi:hypothetical protein
VEVGAGTQGLGASSVCLGARFNAQLRARDACLEEGFRQTLKRVAWPVRKSRQLRRLLYPTFVSQLVEIC